MNLKKLFAPTAIVLFSIALISTSCRRDKVEDNVVPQVTNFPGLGNNEGTPTGTQFVLPSYVSVVGNITGGISYLVKNEVTDKKNFLKNLTTIKDSIGEYATYGTGTYVEIVAKFACSLNHDTTLLLPAGLIFVNEGGESQNGFILQDITIPLQANDTAYAFIKAYCLNASRHISYNYSIYNFSVVTNNAQLLQIVNIMKTKQAPIGNESNIQSIIWNVSDYYGLTNDDRNYLNSLP